MAVIFDLFFKLVDRCSVTVWDISPATRALCLGPKGVLTLLSLPVPLSGWQWVRLESIVLLHDRSLSTIDAQMRGFLRGLYCEDDAISAGSKVIFKLN